MHEKCSKIIRKPERYIITLLFIFVEVVRGFVLVFSLLPLNIDDFPLIHIFNQTVKNSFFLYSENAQTTQTVVPNDATTSEDVCD